MDLAGLHRLSFDLKVGVVRAADVDAERKAAGHAKNAGKLPTSQKDVNGSIPVMAPFSATAQRQVVDPIRIDLVPQVEIRRAAQLVRGPGIHHGAQSAKGRYPLRIRANVD